MLQPRVIQKGLCDTVILLPNLFCSANNIPNLQLKMVIFQGQMLIQSPQREQNTCSNHTAQKYLLWFPCPPTWQVKCYAASVQKLSSFPLVCKGLQKMLSFTPKRTCLSPTGFRLLMLVLVMTCPVFCCSSLLQLP